MSELPIIEKIENGTVTIGDFDDLFLEYVRKNKNAILEATPESARDRIRRRTNKNETDKHQDNKGHQQLNQPKFAARIQPKRERANNTQMHGQGKAAHRKSTRTQRRKAKARSESKQFELTFDKAGYYNSLKELMESHDLVEGRDYAISNHVLSIPVDLKLSDDIKSFLIDVGKAQRIDKTIDIFDY